MNLGSYEIKMVSNLRDDEQRDALACDGTDENQDKGEDVGQQQHQLLETLHPSLRSLRP